MKTLYIHGLDSTPNTEKIDIMKEAGLIPFALHLDYRTEANAYNLLKKEVVENELEFLVGSSLGGYFAYWLAEELGLPCLLLNPAMTIDRTLPLAITHVNERNCPFRYVAIGAKDNIIDPVRNLEFFREADRATVKQRVITCDWMYHVIDFESFATLLDWSLSGIRNNNRFPEFEQ